MPTPPPNDARSPAEGVILTLNEVKGKNPRISPEAPLDNPERSHLHWPHALAFLALCVLSASGWLLDAAWPSPLDLAPRRALHNFASAILLALVSWKHLRALPQLPWRKLALASICLLGLPAILIDFTRGAVPQTTAAALFTLVPVAIIVLAPYLLSSPNAEAGRLLPAALTGLAGALLLLQFALPTSWRQAAFEALILLAVLSAATASLWMYRLLPAFTLIHAALLCTLANALIFAAASALEAHPTAGPTPQLIIELATTLLVDLPQLLLLLWLLRTVAPTRLAARYFVVPLLSVLEGYALLHAGITWQPALGALLLAAGACLLLTRDPAEPDYRLSLH